MLLLDIKLHDVEKLIYITYDAELFTVSRVFNCKLRLQNYLLSVRSYKLHQKFVKDICITKVKFLSPTLADVI